MLASPMPRAVRVSIAIFAVKTIRIALEVVDDRGSVARQIIGMDSTDPIRDGLEWFAGQTDQFADARRIVDRILCYIPFVDALFDCSHGQGVAFFTFPQRPFSSLSFGHIADGPNQTDCPPSGISDGYAPILNPSILAVAVPHTVLTVEPLGNSSKAVA